MAHGALKGLKMASKSTGQIVGTLAGAVIGAFIPGGYVALGASIGGMVGGLVDPVKTKTSGPRLTDLSQQVSGYGNPIPRAYGKIATYGTVFWIENNKLNEVSHTTKSGGKGGGGNKNTTYTYDATFAVSLADCGANFDAIAGVRRIWVTGKLVFDGLASSTSAILQSDDFQSTFSLYRGGIDQMPDPRIQADLGIANTPAWRGMAYIVFNNLPLEDFGNTLMGAQVKVELITTGITNAWQTKLLRDQDMGVSFGKLVFPSMDPETGIYPYITSIDGGIVSMNAYNSTDYYQFILATGDFIGRYSGNQMMIPPQPELGWSTACPGNDRQLGRASNGKYVYCLGDRLGYAPFNITMGPERANFLGGMLDTNIKASRVSKGLSSNYTALACGFNKGNSEIFLCTNQGDWYLIDLNGNIIEEHQTTLPYMFGGNGSTMWGGKTCAVDMSIRRAVCVNALGISVYSLGTDGVITLIADYQPIIGTAIGGMPATIPLAKSQGYGVSVYMDGNIIVLAERHSLQVIAFAAISATPITLGEIVQTECLSSNLLTAGDLDVSELTDVVRGYQITNPGAIRASLEPLRQAWPFDAVPAGYKLKFPKRGKSSVLTIPAGNLVMSGKSEVLTVTREMDTQLPRRIEVAYADVDREYDQNKQSSERLNTDAINATQVELPIVFNATEAAQKAEVLLYAAWLERADLSFVLPPLYRQLEPSDVVTLVTAQAAYEVRIASINYMPDGRLECSGKPNAAATYTSSAVGQTGVYTGQQMTLPGPADLLLLDIPCVNPAYMDKPGLLTGMSPYLDAWKGGAIVRSDDAGQTWEVVDAIAPPGSIAGVTTSQLAAGVTHIVDTANVLDVIVHGGTLVSVTDSALFNGANHFAIGAHGRWEIVGVKTAATLAGNQYRLSNLMRGRFGSEWAMSLHTSADTIVLLDTAALRFVSLNASAINAERLWRGVMKGQSIDAAAETALTYSAVNLKPLAPIHLRGNRNPATFDWTLECERRSRMPVEPFSGTPTPLGETSEAYEVEIWDATFSTLKRTITGLTSKSATWTQAQQIADFGSKQGAVFCRWYELSSIVGRGYPLQGSLSYSLAVDPYIHLNVLGLHFDGTNGSTTFTDVLGKPVTASGNAQISTAQSMFGGASGLFDGAGDYLTISSAYASLFDFGTGDFTIEMFVRLAAMPTSNSWPTSFASHFVPFSHGIPGSGSGYGLVIGQTNIMWNNNDPAVASGAHGMTTSVWYHLAVTRASGTVRIFVNGIKTGEATGITSNYVYAQPAWVGCETGETAWFNGNIDDLRVKKGIALYTANFTPPTEAFANA